MSKQIIGSKEKMQLKEAFKELNPYSLKINAQLSLKNSIIILFSFLFGLPIHSALLPCCDTTPSRFESIPSEPPTGMIWIPGGTFVMGGQIEECMKEWPSIAQSRDDERPLHTVQLDGFWISETPVTNAEFKLFVEATGYKTTAEKVPLIEEIMASLPPGTPPPPKELLVPASLVFTPPDEAISLRDPFAWWRWQKDANWRQPEGPNSSIENRLNHPVVHVSYLDALAYAQWKNMSLPTEAQWEYAARGGKHQETFIWGNEPLVENTGVINIWEGQFPHKNTESDGYSGTSPVKNFKPNDFGLYDMAGNVWEWVADWYHPDAYKIQAAKASNLNPQGPAYSYDPNEPYAQKRVLRGGSFLCNDAYCSGYRPAARMKNAPETSTNHTGFRLVKNKSNNE